MTPQSALREAEARLSFLTPPAGEAPSRVTTIPRAEPVGGSFSIRAFMDALLVSLLLWAFILAAVAL